MQRTRIITMFHAFICVFTLLCAGRFRLGWAHDAFKFACHMFMHFHAYVPSCFYHLILKLLGTFLIFSLSFSLSLPFTLVASWHLNVSPFHPRTLFVPGHLLLLLHLTLLPLMFGSWWEGQIRLLGELYTTRHSFETPSRSVRFLWHWPTYCHL